MIGALGRWRWGLALTTVVLVAGAALGIGGAPDTSSRDERAMMVYHNGLDSLEAALLRLDTALARADDDAVRRSFRHARSRYKRVEVFVEYYARFAVRSFNGPPLPHAEDEDPETPLPPAGFQVIEAAVFPAFSTADIGKARREIGFMRTLIDQLRRDRADTLAGDACVFDAARQQLARVATLGIAGFDASASGDAIIESAEALRGVGDAVAIYRSGGAAQRALDTLDVHLSAAVRYLEANPDFDRFDRLRFISSYVQPLAHSLLAAQRALGIHNVSRPRAWSARAASIYDRDAFDAMFFSSADAVRPTAALIALGRDLFFDARLSPGGKRSCGSCHLPARAFSDGRPRAMLI